MCGEVGGLVEGGGEGEANVPSLVAPRTGLVPKLFARRRRRLVPPEAFRGGGATAGWAEGEDEVESAGSRGDVSRCAACSPWWAGRFEEGWRRERAEEKGAEAEPADEAALAVAPSLRRGPRGLDEAEDRGATVLREVVPVGRGVWREVDEVLDVAVAALGGLRVREGTEAGASGGGGAR